MVLSKSWMLNVAKFRWPGPDHTMKLLEIKNSIEFFLGLDTYNLARNLFLMMPDINPDDLQAKENAP